MVYSCFFFFSSRRRHTRLQGDWSSDVCSSDLSKLKTEIARILKEEGYILNYKVAEEGPKKTIKIYLKYATNTEPVISHIERVSRPGCRVYVGQSDIPRVLGGLGINILTTARGVMTGRHAHKENLGGELLCQIW